MEDMNWLDWTAAVLVLVGAVNWGLVGFFGWNLVNWLFQAWWAFGETLVYWLVGLSGLYMIWFFARE